MLMRLPFVDMGRVIVDFWAQERLVAR